MKKISEKFRQFLSQPVPISVTAVKGEVTPGIFSNIINFSSKTIGMPHVGQLSNHVSKEILPLKVASGIVHNPVLPIVVYWKQKKVYYREDLNSTQIYCAFCEWLDKLDTMHLSTDDGPYVKKYEAVPDMIIRTMEFKIGPLDVVTMTVTRIKDDWQFVDVTKEMLAGMQRDLS
jgi:hypothetical protein